MGSSARSAWTMVSAPSRSESEATATEITFHRSGYGSAIISILALLFSGVSLYETVVKQPCLSLHAAARWHYGRGPGASDEHFTVPLAISNNGAREGIVVSLAMTVERPDGGKKDFAATFTDLAQDSGRRLVAPIAVPGRSAHTATFVFAPNEPGPPLMNDRGTLRAVIRLTHTYERSFGPIDDFFQRPPRPIELTLDVRTFDIATLVRGEAAFVTARTEGRD